MTQFNNLNDIDIERQRLKEAISKKEDELAGLWESLFHKEEESKIQTPTQRIMHYASMGTGILDGAILGWKLYRRFSGAKSSFSLFGGRKRRK